MGSGAAPFPRVLFFGKLKSNTRCTSNLVHALAATRSEEHTSELQSRQAISYAVFCFKKKNRTC